jgi:hypothetical protein
MGHSSAKSRRSKGKRRCRSRSKQQRSSKRGGSETELLRDSSIGDSENKGDIQASQPRLFSGKRIYKDYYFASVPFSKIFRNTTYGILKKHEWKAYNNRDEFFKHLNSKNIISIKEAFPNKTIFPGICSVEFAGIDENDPKNVIVRVEVKTWYPQSIRIEDKHLNSYGEFIKTPEYNNSIQKNITKRVMDFLSKQSTNAKENIKTKYGSLKRGIVSLRQSLSKLGQRSDPDENLMPIYTEQQNLLYAKIPKEGEFVATFDKEIYPRDAYLHFNDDAFLQENKTREEHNLEKLTEFEFIAKNKKRNRVVLDSLNQKPERTNKFTSWIAIPR